MSFSILITKIEKDIEKTEKLISERNNNLDINSKIFIDLEEYSKLESSLETYISLNLGNIDNGQGMISINNDDNPNLENNQFEYNIYNKKKSLKILRKNLLDNFLKFDTKRFEFMHKLNKIFYSNEIINNINQEEIINNLGKNNSLEDNQNINFYNNICNIIISNINNIIINKLLINNDYQKNINKIPEFIMFEFNQLIKQKIFMEWSLN